MGCGVSSHKVESRRREPADSWGERRSSGKATLSAGARKKKGGQIQAKPSRSNSKQKELHNLLASAGGASHPLPKEKVETSLAPARLTHLMGLQKLKEISQEICYSENEIVFNQGDKPDALYIVHSGNFEVVMNDEVIDHKKNGDIFGHAALMEGVVRTAAVKAASPNAKLIRIAINAQNMSTFESAKQEMEATADVLRQTSFFASLSRDNLLRLATAVSAKMFYPNQVVIPMGAEVDSIMIVRTGTIALLNGSKEAPGWSTARSTEGDILCEQAFLRSQASKYSCLALDHVVIWTINRAALTGMDFGKTCLSRMDEIFSTPTIRSLKLFEGLTADELSAVMGEMHIRQFQAGSMIARRGDISDCVYILKSGTAQLQFDGNVINMLDAGAIIGEVGVVFNVPRTADIIAVGTCTCLWMDRDAFSRLPALLVARIHEVASQRQVRTSISNENIKVHDLSAVQVIATIGKGGFGRIKLVRVGGEAVGRVVVMKAIKKSKVLEQKMKDQITQERRLMRKLHHPFVLDLRGTFQDSRYAYLFMDYMPGGDFYALLFRLRRYYGSIPPHMSRFYAANMIIALEYLHAHGIMHRDLKPENFLVGADGYLRVTDFGFAKQFKRERTGDLKGRTKTRVGSLEYMAPEIILDKGCSTIADLWSMGVLIFEMIVGKSPFKPQRGLTDLQVCKNIVHRVIPFPSWMDQTEVDIIEQLLQLQPEHRLGAGPDGFWSLKNHRFFAGIDFEEIESMTVKAPWMPKVRGSEDTRYFHCNNADDDVTMSDQEMQDVWGPELHFDGWDSPTGSKPAPDFFGHDLESMSIASRSLSNGNSLRSKLSTGPMSNHGIPPLGDLPIDPATSDKQSSPSGLKGIAEESEKNATTLTARSIDVSTLDTARSHN